MAITSDPKYQPFIEVLGMRLFRIPEYQRCYSWEEHQIKDLFEDITKLYGKKAKDKYDHHFMATIVCLNTLNSEELGSKVLPVLHVVDGQQRLTTLIILLKAISKKLLLESDSKYQEEGLELNKLLIKDDDRLILLQTNHDSSNVFRNYLKNGFIPKNGLIKTMAEKKMRDAFRLCEKYVDEWNLTRDIIDLLKIVKNRLDFIFYELSDEQSVYTVFEVLNSRGLPVDSLDKCKSMLMGIAFDKFQNEVATEKIGELHNLWSSIYRTIGINNINSDEILRFTATLMHSSPISQPVSGDESLLQFRSLCESMPHKVIEITQKILEVTEKLTKLHSTKRLEAVIEISYARLLAVAIYLNPSLDDQQRQDVLNMWERVTFKVFSLCDKDSRFSRGDFTKLAYEVYNDKMSKDKIIQRLKSIGDKYSFDEVLKNISDTDCYNNWTKELRYFLYQFEEYLAELSNEKVGYEMWEKIWESSSSTTIEHIFPQTPDIGWKGKIDPNNDPDIITHNINRIGNLALLPPGMNSSIKNFSFVKKKEIYKNSGLRMVAEVAKKKDWNLKAINERENLIIKFAKQRWDFN
jgi:uncharacterized protein with ParB-like and HNH nuclease domain